ncbi:MAG: cytochrome c3 family protein, partial [Planctomycetota bacterium]
LASIPSVTVCASCHGGEPRTTSLEETRLREQFLAKGRDVPWVQVTTVGPNVHFSHQAHVRFAGHGCTRCHEDMRFKAAPPTVASVFTMGGCMRCHEEHAGQNECLTCHK